MSAKNQEFPIQGHNKAIQAQGWGWTFWIVKALPFMRRWVLWLFVLFYSNFHSYFISPTGLWPIWECDFINLSHKYFCKICDAYDINSFYCEDRRGLRKKQVKRILRNKNRFLFSKIFPFCFTFIPLFYALLSKHRIRMICIITNDGECLFYLKTNHLIKKARVTININMYRIFWSF